MGRRVVGIGRQRRIVDLDGDVEARVGLEVERRAGLKPQVRADNLEQRRVVAGKGEVVGAERIVVDRDGRYRDGRAGVGVLVKIGDGGSEGYRRRLVDVVDRNRVGRRVVGIGRQRRIVDLDGDVEARVGLEVERRAGLKPQVRADNLEQRGVISREGQVVRADAVVGDGDRGNVNGGAGVGVLVEVRDERIQGNRWGKVGCDRLFGGAELGRVSARIGDRCRHVVTSRDVGRDHMTDGPVPAPVGHERVRSEIGLAFLGRTRIREVLDGECGGSQRGVTVRSRDRDRRAAVGGDGADGCGLTICIATEQIDPDPRVGVNLVFLDGVAGGPRPIHPHADARIECNQVPGAGRRATNRVIACATVDIDAAVVGTRPVGSISDGEKSVDVRSYVVAGDDISGRTGPTDVDASPAITGDHVPLGCRSPADGVVVGAASPDIDAIVVVLDGEGATGIGPDQVALNEVIAGA